MIKKIENNEQQCVSYAKSNTSAVGNNPFKFKNTASQSQILFCLGIFTPKVNNSLNIIHFFCFIYYNTKFSSVYETYLQ